MDQNENQNGDQGAIDASEDQGATEQVAADPIEGRIKGMQSEYGRKIENMNQQLADTNAQIQALLAQVSSQQQASQPAAKPLKELMFDDPDAFVAHVQAEANKAAKREVNSTVQMSQASQSVVMDLQSKYPEFSQPGSEAARLALQYAARLPENQRGTPQGIKLAMMDAVLELGLAPAQRRQNVQQQRTDDFSVSSNSGAAARGNANRPGDTAKKIDKNTLAFAELLGLDLNDAKRVENLSKASQRKNWTSYSS